jgi:hypothetical protein
VTERRFLYFTATRVVLYRWAQNRLAAESSFANSEEGAHAFATVMRGVSRSVFSVLVDIVEEDFHQENVPFVRGADRKVMLARKLAQRYRDTGLSLALSLGYEKTQRRDERMLFSSFTNTAPFQPWLRALREQEAIVVGVYSVALLAPRLAGKIGPRNTALLLVTLQQAGLRQSFVDGGTIRFSRLGSLEATDLADPRNIANAFERETTRVYQYLTAMRLLAQEDAAVDALLLAPPGQKRELQSISPSLPQIRVSVLELGEAARAIGLKAFPAASGAEVLFLHLLAKDPPAVQYAGPELRQFHTLRRLRTGLIAGGAAVSLVALGFAAYQLFEVFKAGERTAVDRQQAAAANSAYARVTAGFPKLPTTTDNLRMTMQKYTRLATQTADAERLIVDVSLALEASPRIELERLQWEITANPKDRSREGDPARNRGGSQPPPGQTPPAAMYEVAEIGATVLAVRPSDYRNITLTVNEFLETLRKRPGVEVIQANMPFELGPRTRLSGDIGAETSTAVPRFSVIVARKLGS